LHLHQREEHAKQVGMEHKLEAYYFLVQMNHAANSFPYSFFGLEPGTTKEDIRRCLERDSAIFQQLSQGLLRRAGVRQDNTLLGVGEGSKWIDALFEDLGVQLRILDVFHATGYLETVMQELAWHEEKRLAECCSWLRGDINARVWLRHYLPAPEVWFTWSQPAQTALQYLETRLDQMDYATFKAKGYLVGSGQIERANKSVIAARMKRGGMPWSHQGGNRMAMLRSVQFSFRPVTDFQHTRLLAFPVPQL
jgi:hypothetical protein